MKLSFLHGYATKLLCELCKIYSPNYYTKRMVKPTMTLTEIPQFLSPT